MCFSTYEDDILEGAGMDWISCACGRWLHEDCAEDRKLDDQGKELVCPYCKCNNIISLLCFVIPVQESDI